MEKEVEKWRGGSGCGVVMGGDGAVVLPQLADRPLPLTYPLTRSLRCSLLFLSSIRFGFSFSFSGISFWGGWGVGGK